MQNKREREEASESTDASKDISKKQKNETIESNSEPSLAHSELNAAASDSKASDHASDSSACVSSSQKEKADTEKEKEEEKVTPEKDRAPEKNSGQGATEATSVSTTTTVPTNEVKAVSAGPKLGFGAFASKSAPFKSATALTQKAEDAAIQNDTDWAASSSEKVPENQEIVVRKKEVQKPEIELTTGEEDETTVQTSRVKLYSMSKDQSWKERGTGLLKLNSQEDSKTARLVMRSEGVLKLILNVKLFAGMQCDLEQERFLRLLAMEPEGLIHFAIKFANATEANAFLKQLRMHIPPREASSDDK